MLAEALRTLYGYNGWATERLFDTAAQATSEQLLAPGTAGHGSIKDTLLHLVITQKRWLSWWNGSMSAADAYGLPVDLTAYPDLPAVRAEWDQVESATRTFVAGLSDADAERVLTAELPNGQTWHPRLCDLMLHLANHGTQHRSEVAAMLTVHGHSPGDLDMLLYIMLPGKGSAG